MSWLRLDSDYAADGTVRRCRAVLWWPLILCAMKRGNGVVSDDDIAPEVLADIGQGDEDAARLAIERLKSAGKLIACEGGWTTPGWHEMQPDPTASDRARRYRERNRAASESASRCVTVTERDVTVRHGDVTDENGASRLTGHTGQDIHTGHSERKASTTTSRARDPDPPPPTSTSGTARAAEAFRLAQAGREAMMVSPRTIQALGELVDAHGADVVVEAIDRAAESCRGSLTVAYLRPVVDAVAKGEPRGQKRPAEAAGRAAHGRHRDDRRTDEFGPIPLAPGKL